MRPDGDRDLIAGPESGPQPPFPIRLSGPVVKGFGRGSKELGIPTANIPPEPLSQYPHLSTGVYYGLVALLLPANGSISRPTSGGVTADTALSIHAAVLSIGYNPFYGNQQRSIEIHILEPPLPSPSAPSSTVSLTPTLSSSSSSSMTSLPSEFYGAPLNLLILGFIRPEYDYVSKELLIKDIQTDCQVARRSLDRDMYRSLEGARTHEGAWLRDFDWVGR